MADPFLQLTDITKTYPGVTALSKVSLSVAPGEVIGLVGENGAGKSTLMKILGGVVEPSSGQILVDGAARAALTVPDAILAGIAFVHQELNLFDNLDAAANVFIGREPLYGGPLRLIDRKALYAQARPYFELLDVDFKPETMVSELSIGQRQLLEIIKALSLDARLIIMDEPTSSLTLSETDRLLGIIADLKAKGVSVIFISHRLNELTECADRVIVLRDGHVVGHLDKAHVTHGEMIRLMIGRDLKSLYLPPASPPGANVLEIAEARTETYPDHPISLQVRRGEILGLAGLIGAGRTELARTIFGIDRLLGGTILLDGAQVEIRTPREAIALGVFLVPEDRKRSGLLLEMSIAENISLPDLLAYASNGLVQDGRVTANAEAQRQRLHIRAPNVGTETGSLSGGNQQKVVIAKWLMIAPRIILLNDPTRGIDVGTKQEIYQLLRKLADDGATILFYSTDYDELIGCCDRVLVMYDGAIVRELKGADITEHALVSSAFSIGSGCMDQTGERQVG